MRYFKVNKTDNLKVLAAKSAVLLILFIIPLCSAAQDDDLKVSKSVALKLFENGDYNSAYRYFDILGSKFPRDPEYMYFRGACLVELGNTGQAIELLEEAISLSNSVKSVPAEAYYYLGRAFQHNSRFTEAIDNYVRFRDMVRKRVAKDYRIDQLIAMCTAGNTGKEIKSQAEISTGIVKDQDIEADTLDTVDPDIVDISERKAEEIKTGERKNVEIENTPLDYDSIAEAALEYQFKADSLSRLAARYRSSLRNLSGNDRESIRKKILDIESDIFSYQSLADAKLTEAAAYNRLKFEGSFQDSIARNTADVGAREEPQEEKTSLILQEQSDTTGKDDSTIVVDTLPPPVPVLKLFNDKEDQPADIPVNQKLPDGLYYRIQIAAFRNPVKPSYFRKLGPVYGIKAADSDITFYFIGMFRKQSDARNALMKVRDSGFRDAFIVAILEGERISSERADSLEDKWSGVSLVTQVATRSKSVEPLTLVFRIEAGKSDKEFSDEIIETYRILAGNRDFDIIKNEEEEYVCLIGKFLTFESAQQYSDLLYRNGLKEANVVAYMGEKEIPVEKAKELFKLNSDK